MIRRPPRSTLFPTRRSSDLATSASLRRRSARPAPVTTDTATAGRTVGPSDGASTSDFVRSEEHTSELQSQSNLVCRLLLEKKKKKHNILSMIQRTRPRSDAY